MVFGAGTMSICALIVAMVGAENLAMSKALYSDYVVGSASIWSVYGEERHCFAVESIMFSTHFGSIREVLLKQGDSNGGFC